MPSIPKTPSASPSATVVIIAVITILCFVTAAVLYTGDSGPANERFGLLIGLVGIVIPALFALLRSDQTQQQTNGSLDARIHAGVVAALQSRAVTQATDHPEVPMTRDTPSDATS